MHILTFVTFGCLATLACCLTLHEEETLDDILHDLENLDEFNRRLPVENLETLETASKVKPFKPPVLQAQKKDPCSRACCDDRKTWLYLGTLAHGVNNGMADVVTVVDGPTTTGNVENFDCNKRALLKVKFDKFGCPFCGRYLLRIDLELSREARSSDPARNPRRMLNFGDSQSNDGFKGDASHQFYDAEADGYGDHIRVYGNDHCKDEKFNPLVFTDALAAGATHVTVYLGNEYIRVTNDMGFDQEACSECLYALNGQPDTTVNQDIYVALNRVVSNRADRRGHGVCAATLSWVCGWK